MIRKLLITVFFILSSSAVMAQPPEGSLRPVARGQVAPSVITPATRPTAPEPEAQERRGLFRVLRPKPRSERVGLFASKRKRALRRGMVCGDLALQGEELGRVPGKIGGCGVNGAVRLRSVSGVALSQQAVMDCGTAKALKTWVDHGLKPSVGRRGGGVAQIRVAAHYACRPRNNRKGAKISEHGKGRAIDISAVRLEDGSEINVLRDWGQGWRGRALKEMHARACGPFGTVLGPDGDRYHRDHLHFDTARYRSGSYCR